MTKSTTMKAITRQNVGTLQRAMLAALAGVGEQFGVRFEQDGNGRFTPTTFRMKVLATLLDTSAAPVAVAPTAAKFPPGLPVTDADIGKTVNFTNGEFRIAGYLPGQRKNTVALVKVSDGSTGHRAAPATVAQLLGRNPYPNGGDPTVYPGQWDKLDNESLDEYFKRTEAMLAAIPRDKMISFPRGDGRAIYFVASLKPLKLQHVPYGDAWHADPLVLRALKASDVQAMIEREAGMRRLFANRPEPGAPPAPGGGKRKRKAA